MEFPEVFTFDDSDDESSAGDALADHLRALQIDAPLVVASEHGAALAARVRSVEAHQRDEGADQVWALGIGSRAIRAGADAIVAIGGGRCLDVGKLAAARAGVPVVAVPTQLSHDGICSPVAVVPNAAGINESLGALAPRAVFVSLPTLVGAPPESVAAGVGDLLANPFALRDWALAAERGLEDTNQEAWDLSVESYQRVKPHLDEDPRRAACDPVFLHELAQALVLSGASMIRAGTSRPASGAEHEVSHAIDQLHGGPGMHGAQVAFGCIISVALYGEDTNAWRDQLARLGLPHHPGHLGLSHDDLVGVLLKAPDTRPGRFTIIEHANLDESSARALVERIWSDL